MSLCVWNPSACHENQTHRLERKIKNCPKNTLTNESVCQKPSPPWRKLLRHTTSSVSGASLCVCLRHTDTQTQISVEPTTQNECVVLGIPQPVTKIRHTDTSETSKIVQKTPWQTSLCVRNPHPRDENSSNTQLQNAFNSFVMGTFFVLCVRNPHHRDEKENTRK